MRQGEWAVFISDGMLDLESEHGNRIVGVYAHGANDCDIPEALEKYENDVRGWKSQGLIDAILRKKDEWHSPAGDCAIPAHQTRRLRFCVTARTSFEPATGRHSRLR